MPSISIDIFAQCDAGRNEKRAGGNVLVGDEKLERHLFLTPGLYDLFSAAEQQYGRTEFRFLFSRPMVSTSPVELNTAS